MAKLILFRLLALILIIAALNEVYRLTLYNEDMQLHCKEILKLRASIPQTDIYYFGESSNTTFTEDDSTQSSISDLTAAQLPQYRLTNINKEATHAGIYRHWLHEFDRENKYPKALIITMNLRSFDAAWINSDLENSLQQALVLSRPGPPIVNRFLLSLQAFKFKTQREREEDMLEDWKTKRLPLSEDFKYHTVREWDDGMANGGYLLPDGNWDMKKIELACHYIKAYAFSIDETNPRIKDFDAITDWCREHKVHLYLNLMSENVHYADSLAGPELAHLIRTNRDHLVKRYTRAYSTVVDNLELVNSSDFIDQNWTTEHYRCRGRLRIARHLAEAIKSGR